MMSHANGLASKADGAISFGRSSGHSDVEPDRSPDRHRPGAEQLARAHGSSQELRCFDSECCCALACLMRRCRTAVACRPGGVARSSRERPHRDHRQHAGRTSAVRRLARSQTPREISEARPRLSQPWLQRRRGRDAPSIQEFRHARRVAQRQAGADWRVPGEPLRRRQHAGRCHLRVLRLQRVLRRRSRTAGVPAAADRVDPAHALAAVQRPIGSAGRVVLADRARRSRKSVTFRTGARTTSGWSSTRRAMGEVARAGNVLFVDLFTPSQALYAATAAPLTMNGVHLNAEGNRLMAGAIEQQLFGSAPTRDAVVPRAHPAGRPEQELPLVPPLPHARTATRRTATARS